MKLVLQRVLHAAVEVDDVVVGSIEHGLLVLVGIAAHDTERDADYLAKKVVEMRVFEDADGKMNRSVGDVEGAVLAVSQFTLLGDCRKGRRPSFTAAAAPLKAQPLFDHFVRKVRDKGTPVATGQFGAHMEVSLLNDGPVTIILESH